MLVAGGCLWCRSFVRVVPGSFGLWWPARFLVAERVVQRISEQGFGEYLSLAPAPPEAQVGGRSVLLMRQ